MNMKNASITVVIFVTTLVVIFFIVLNFRHKVKTINIDMNDVAQTDSNISESDRTEQDSEINVENLQDDKVLNNELSADKKNSVSIEDEKVEPKNQPLVENKTTNVPNTSTDTKNISDKKIVQKLVSWGFAKSSSRTVKAVIVHTSYNNLGGDVFDFDKVIQEWKDAGVSPHYAIDRNGTIYQLVLDNNIAWHAGVSKLPDGTTDVNGVSIGVEVINSQDAKFTDTQYEALNSLIAGLKKKYSIKYILGHDEIAPGRKTDPWNINWEKVRK